MVGNNGIGQSISGVGASSPLGGAKATGTAQGLGALQAISQGVFGTPNTPSTHTIDAAAESAIALGQ